MLYATLVECLFHLLLEYLCDSLKKHVCACFNLDKSTCQCICIVLCFLNTCVNVTSTLQDITKKKEDGVGAISSLSGHLVSQSPLFTPLQQLTGLISPPDRRKTSKIYNYDCYCSVLLQRTGNNTGTHSEQFSSP